MEPMNINLPDWAIALIVLTAGALIALLVLKPKSSEASAAQAGIKRAQWIGAAWGGGVVGILALIISGLPSTKPAQEMPQGHPPTTQEQGDPEIPLLLETLKTNPSDTNALAKLSHKLLRAMQIQEAKAINDKLLSVDAKHIEGRIHAAVIQTASGEQALGITALDGLLKENPTAAEGWFFRGMLAMQNGDNAIMRTSFENFVKYAEEGPLKTRIAGMLQNMPTGGPAAK